MGRGMSVGVCPGGVSKSWISTDLGTVGALRGVGVHGSFDEMTGRSGTDRV